MAIIKCRKCKGNVSVDQNICPHCGAQQTGGTGWLKIIAIALVAAIGVLLILIAIAPPVDPEKAKERDVIARCWEEQSRKSLDPGEQRFMASMCEKFEDDYKTRYGSKP